MQHEGQSTQQKARQALCLGMGYVAEAFAAVLRGQGWDVAGTNRQGREGALAFAGPPAGAALVELAAKADAVLISIPPGPEGDPALRSLPAGAFKPGAWIGYLSTTGVYGDRGGGWVFEDSPTLSQNPRSIARIAAEQGWQARGGQIFRLSGIYGPGRSALDRLRAGDAQRIIKPDQVFSRVHVDDIVSALMLSMARPDPGRVYALCDDEPCPPQDVIAYAAQLIGAPIPPEIAFDPGAMSAMAASFYAENRRVSNARAKAAVGWRPAFPTYREGLKAILKADAS
jgi:nucleoside-diphosphate-sugar epimerase